MSAPNSQTVEDVIDGLKVIQRRRGCQIALGDIIVVEKAIQLLERHSGPEGEGKLWLWKNFVDGRPEYWAFDNPYPINLDNGDPQTLGEPCGYAILKPSRQGRFDVSEAEVIAAIKRASSRCATDCSGGSNG